MMTVRYKFAWLALALAIITIGGDRSVKAQERQITQEGSVYGAYMAGRFAIAQQDLEHGLEHLNRAIELAPHNAALKSQAAFLHASLGEVSPAARLSRELELAGAGDEITPVILMAEAVRQGNFQLAQEHIASIESIGVGVVTKPLFHAWALAGQNRIDDAIAYLEGEAAQEIAQTPLVYYHVALLHELAGNLELAEQYYRKALTQGESKAQRIVEATGSFYERHRSMDAARKFYQGLADESRENWFAREALDHLNQGGHARPAVTKAADGFAEVLFNSAGMVYSNDDVNDALFMSSVCLYLKPDFANASMMQAALLDEMDRLEQARAAYQNVPKDSAFYWRSQIEQALILYKMDREPQALRALMELTELRPDSHDPYVNIADIQKASGQFREAAASYTVALKKLGEPQGWHWPLYYARGIAYERSGDWGQAEADLHKALDLSPDNPDVLNYLAYSWVERGKNLPQAKAMLAKAMDQKSEDASILDSYGWVHYKLGDVKKAVYYLEQAVELMPSDAVVNDHLGDAYWAAGRTKEARFQWARTLTLDPDATLSATIEDKIANGLAIRTANTESAESGAELVERARLPETGR